MVIVQESGAGPGNARIKMKLNKRDGNELNGWTVIAFGNIPPAFKCLDYISD